MEAVMADYGAFTQGLVQSGAFNLNLVESLTARGALSGYHLLAAARADLLRRLGRCDEALAAYREALSLARFDQDRRWLARQVDELEGESTPR